MRVRGASAALGLLRLGVEHEQRRARARIEGRFVVGLRLEEVRALAIPLAISLPLVLLLLVFFSGLFIRLLWVERRLCVPRGAGGLAGDTTQAEGETRLRG